MRLLSIEMTLKQKKTWFHAKWCIRKLTVRISFTGKKIYNWIHNEGGLTVIIKLTEFNQCDSAQFGRSYLTTTTTEAHLKEIIANLRSRRHLVVARASTTSVHFRSIPQCLCHACFKQTYNARSQWGWSACQATCSNFQLQDVNISQFLDMGVWISKQSCDPPAPRGHGEKPKHKAGRDKAH